MFLNDVYFFKKQLFLSLTACTTLDNDETINELIVSDFTFSITENPENGDSIGFIETSTVNNNLSFSILNQNPNGSVEINPTTGERIIVDKKNFEYQINPIISATIQVSDSINSENIPVTINLIEWTKIYYGDIILETKRT